MNAFDLGYKFGMAKAAEENLFSMANRLNSLSSSLKINRDKSNAALDSKLDDILARLEAERAADAAPPRARTSSGTKINILGEDPAAKKLIKKKRKIIERAVKDLMNREKSEDVSLDFDLGFFD